MQNIGTGEALTIVYEEAFYNENFEPFKVYCISTAIGPFQNLKDSDVSLENWGYFLIKDNKNLQQLSAGLKNCEILWVSSATQFSFFFLRSLYRFFFGFILIKIAEVDLEINDGGGGLKSIGSRRLSAETFIKWSRIY